MFIKFTEEKKEDISIFNTQLRNPCSCEDLHHVLTTTV